MKEVGGKKQSWGSKFGLGPTEFAETKELYHSLDLSYREKKRN